MTDLITELKALKEKVGPGMVRVPTNCPDLAAALVNHLPTILAKLEEGERMREALADILDYRGGADCACKDEHVLDRLRGAHP